MRQLSAGELIKNLEWLASEVKHPCDLTFHTVKAKEDFEKTIKTVAYTLTLIHKDAKLKEILDV